MLFACAQATSTNITAVDTAGGSGITDDAAGCHAAHQRLTPPCHSSDLVRGSNRPSRDRSR